MEGSPAAQDEEQLPPRRGEGRHRAWGEAPRAAGLSIDADDPTGRSAESPLGSRRTARSAAALETSGPLPAAAEPSAAAGVPVGIRSPSGKEVSWHRLPRTDSRTDILVGVAEGMPPILKRLSRAAAAATAPVLKEMKDWQPGRVLSFVLIFVQLLVVVFYASELYDVYLVAQANPAISQDTRAEQILLYPNVVVCNANAPGVPLEVLSCELAAASGRATPCGEGIRRFALPASRAALGARPARALAEANAVDAAGAASVADAAGAAGAAGAPGAPAPQGSADGEAEAGVASSARGESAGPATPAPEPAANASAPAFTSAQPSEGGAAAQPEAAPAPATPTPAPGTPAPEPAPIPPDAPRKIPTVALHPLPTPLPPAAPASNANATATPALPPARMHCIGIASHLGPAERYEHLDVSLRVHTELFPPPPTPRAVHIWLLGDAEYETVVRAGGEPLEEGGSGGGGAEAAPRSRAGAPRPLRPRAPLPEPDLYSVEVKYLTRVALDQVETVSLAQGSRAGGSDGSDHRTLHSFFAFYSRALGFDERLIHPSGDEPGGEGGARAGRRGESEREGAGARADAAGDLSPDEARALALERAHSAQAGAAQTFDGGLVGLPAREAARLVRYTPSVSIQQVQGPFQSLDCVFLELRWRSTDVTVRTQYVTFTWTQLLAGIFATTTFTTLARSLLIWTLELLVHYGRWLLLVAAAAWRRRQRGERAAAADADPEGGGLGPGEGRAATAPAAQHGGYDKLD